MQVFNLMLSVALYVLQALGLYALAKRRGIRYAWLAWVPLGVLWVLGALSDDYRARVRGKQRKMRLYLPVLCAVLVVLLVMSLASAFKVMEPLRDVITLDELVAFYQSQMATDSVSHMYDTVQDDALAQMEQRLTEALTEAEAEAMLAATGPMLLVTLVAAVLSLVLTVLQYMCLYDLFASCNPGMKVLYLLLSIFFGVEAVIIYFCRNQDLGMLPPNPGLPGGFTQDPPGWNY